MAIYDKSMPDSQRHPYPWRISSGFFLGMSLFIAEWKLLDSLIGSARIALAIYLLSVLALIILMRSYTKIVHIFRLILANFKIITALLLIVTPLLIVYWLPPQNLHEDSSIGSYSSFLYANKSIYFAQNNVLLSVSRNVGQSMLASIPLFAGFKSTVLLNLLYWIVAGAIFLTLLVFGFFRLIQFSEKRAWLGTIIVLCGNTALSITNVSVRDMGSPYLLIGYAHVLFSAGSFLVSVVWFYFLLSERVSSWPWILLFLSSTIVSWAITAPENIILGFPFFAWLLLKHFRGNVVSVKTLLMLVGSAAFFLFIGITQGGLLSPQKFRHDNVIPGSMVSPVGSSVILPNPGVGAPTVMGPIYVEVPRPYSYNYVKAELPNYRAKLAKMNQETVEVILEMWVRTEVELWAAIRANFFPILGLILLFLLVRNFSGLRGLYAHVLLGSTITFLGGFLIAFPIMYGVELYKWPLSRFFQSGHLLGLICFVIAFDIISQKYLLPNRKRRAWIIVVTLMTFGPMTHLIVSDIWHIKTKSPDGADIVQRARRLVTFSEIWNKGAYLIK